MTVSKPKSGLFMKYFVLKPAGKDSYAEASRRAMIAYAHCIKGINPTLAEELRAWVEMEDQSDDKQG